MVGSRMKGCLVVFSVVVLLVAGSFSGCFESSAKVDFSYAPETPIVGNSIQFVSPSGSFVKFLWDFGDGNTSLEENPSHAYVSNGTYTVKLTVWNSEGNSYSVVKNITVSDVPNTPPEVPVIEASSVSDLQPWVLYMFRAKSTDIDGDNISYCFDWGDNISDCTNRYYKSGWYTSEHFSWHEPGTYEVKVKAKDERGAESGWNSVNVTVVSSKVLDDFNITTLDGGVFRLSDYLGKVVVIDFVATSCGGCWDQLGILKSVYENVSDDVVFLTVDVQNFNPRTETLDNVSKMKNDSGATWSFAFDTLEKGVTDIFIRDHVYGMSVPDIFIVNTSGHLVFSHTGVLSQSVLIEKINDAFS